MKKLTFAIVLFFVFLSTALITRSWWLTQLTAPQADSSEMVTVDVPAGSTFSQTIDRLAELRLIRSSLVAKIYVRMAGKGNQLKPGNFSLSPAWPLPDIITSLTSGPADIRVTIPEGWRREQIAGRLAVVLKADSGFDPADFLSQTSGLEGQLFPDTYYISPSTPTKDIIDMFLANFQKQTSLDMAKSYSISLDSQTITLTGHQVLIFASLLEREARLEADRQLVAGILLRRFLADWPLQVDATVQYAVDSAKCSTQPLTCDWWKPIFDTSYTSLYNTYLQPGLPPSPIANPGRATINSILHPKSSEYWFYLTDKDGITHYGRDLPEHQSNVDKYLKP